MESVAIEEQLSNATENGNKTQNFKEFESAENFQKFIYELFEKNGILNDLRAYLRGHIVNVLKSAQTGDPPTCQKHFTQRLELTFQALNMLIAEYLLRLEFSYSLSVFVSEIPLANMVFDFAKNLLNTGDEAGLRFKESDVWSVLNYLGIKCDSEHASNIVQMYKSEDLPLLLCILRCIPMYHRESSCFEQIHSSEGSLSSSALSLDSAGSRERSRRRRGHSPRERCKHSAACTACHARFVRLREKYKKKKKSFAKTMKHTSLNQLSVETLMKNVSVMERSLIDEMFQQLKTVYETEVEMLKDEEDKKAKRSLAIHALQLQKRRDEMEEAYKAREEELERNVQQKKQFLWGLARALRDQHQQMARAMLAVRHESERLSAKEDSLKSQLLESEQMLRKRGEEMRKQISSELVILEGHLENMKTERDSLHRERSKLEELKCLCDRGSNIQNLELNEDLRSNYDLLKNELTILRKYLESTKMEAKCVVDRSTVTELSGVASKLSILLNNEQDADRNCTREEERGLRTPNQVINDLKKAKNVNFSQTNQDDLARERSRSSTSSVCGDARAAEGDLTRLREENHRLKTFARQQRIHIDELSSQQARLQTELAAARARAALPAARPHTAPALQPRPEMVNGHSVNASASANTFGWRKGAGEELNLFSIVQPRVAVPGDPVPFIGVLRDRHSDSRRHLMNQWRALRRRYSPMGAMAQLSGTERAHTPWPSTGSAGAGACEQQPVRLRDDEEGSSRQAPHFSYQTRETFSPRPCATGSADKNRRDKSPKSLLREAKEKLRNKDTSHKNIKDTPPLTCRDKSPNCVLREAKLRLRKLEIEAEAVEKSYLDFKKRQTELREERRDRSQSADKDEAVTKDIVDLGSRRSRSLHKLNETYQLEREQSYHRDKQAIKQDFDKYLREYETALNMSSHFTNRNTVATRAKPIPQTYSNANKNVDKPKEGPNDNYLEKPLTEFRKLYHSQKHCAMPFRIVDNMQMDKPIKQTEDEELDNKNLGNDEKDLEVLKDALIKEKHDKEGELEILKRNINKMYNLQDSPKTDTPEKISLIETDGKVEPLKSEVEVIEIQNSEKNLFRIEVETVTESEKQDVLLVVQSSVETREVVQSDSETDAPKISTNMTILISPKRSSPERDNDIDLDRSRSPEKSRRSVSPEQAARLTRNDVLDAIFHADMNQASSLTMQPEPEATSKEIIEDSISEVEKDLHDDYPDDFSADVDNYNSRSEYNRSPISLPKTSEDENFWDS